MRVKKFLLLLLLSALLLSALLLSGCRFAVIEAGSVVIAPTEEAEQR